MWGKWIFHKDIFAFSKYSWKHERAREKEKKKMFNWRQRSSLIHSFSSSLISIDNFALSFTLPHKQHKFQPQNKAFVCLLFKGTNMSMPFDFNSKRRRRRVRESRVECQISIINLMPIDYSNDSLYMHIVDNRWD